MSKAEVMAPLQQEKAERFIKQYGAGPREVPVSWIREYGKGRMFYTNFGHREETFMNKAIMQHMLDGILWALGRTKVDATPSAELPPVMSALAPDREE